MRDGWMGGKKDGWITGLHIPIMQVYKVNKSE